MRNIFWVVLLLAIFASCEEVEGCGEVVGGYVYYGEYYLQVDFYGKVKNKKVDEKTWIDYGVGEIICF